LLEEGLQAIGVVVWPMVELEADDALAGAAASLSKLAKVGRIYICTQTRTWPSAFETTALFSWIVAHELFATRRV
jgi:hypothetical protein